MASLKQRLVVVLDEERPPLGFGANIEFAGALDDGVAESLAAEVIHIVRTALSDTAHHAQAENVQISVTLAGQLLSVDVIDDGPPASRITLASDVTNMRDLAQRYGGTLDLRTTAEGGTHLHWTANCA